MIPLLFLLIQSARADDYQSQLNALDARGRQIDSQMARLGFGAGHTDEPATKLGETRTSILQIYDLKRTLTAEAGKLLSGRTHTRLVVSSEGAPAIIEISGNQGALSGLRLLGKARASGTPGRIQIDFDRLILKTGRAVPVTAWAMDESGAYGLEAEVISSKALSVAGAMASSFISGIAAAQQTQSTTPFGFTQTQPTGRNAILQGVAQTAADQSKRLIEESTKEKPILVLDAGTLITVFFNEEVRL